MCYVCVCALICAYIYIYTYINIFCVCECVYVWVCLCVSVLTSDFFRLHRIRYTIRSAPGRVSAPGRRPGSSRLRGRSAPPVGPVWSDRQGQRSGAACSGDCAWCTSWTHMNSYELSICKHLPWGLCKICTRYVGDVDVFWHVGWLTTAIGPDDPHINTLLHATDPNRPMPTSNG